MTSKRTGPNQDRCRNCGAWVDDFGKHVCDPGRVRRLEAARKQDRDLVARRRTVGERLYEGLRIMEGNE